MPGPIALPARWTLIIAMIIMQELELVWQQGHTACSRAIVVLEELYNVCLMVGLTLWHAIKLLLLLAEASGW